MTKTFSENTPSNSYIVLVTDWNKLGTYWVKGFSTLEAARKAANEKAAEHKEIMNRIVIIRGEIVQIGNHDL